MLFTILLASLSLTGFLWIQKDRSKLITPPRPWILPISIRRSSSPLTSRSAAMTSTPGKMSMRSSIRSCTSSPSRTNSPGNSQSSLMGCLNGVTGHLSIYPLPSTKKLREPILPWSKVMPPITSKDMITGQTTGSQGDPIVGGSIMGATFVGPIQVNLGYGNSVSQRRMLSIGAGSSISLPLSVPDARSVDGYPHLSRSPAPQKDWVSQTSSSHAGLIGSNCVIYAALLLPLADKR